MNILQNRFTGLTALLLISIFLTSLFPEQKAFGASATEIDIGVNATLRRFKSDIAGGSEFLSRAKGVLVFPSIIKVGFVFGGEYGEGALLSGGKTVDYYNTAAASFGFQLGAQKKSLVQVFLNSSALQNFRNSKGWKANVDGLVAFIKRGVVEDINTTDIIDPIVCFIFSNRGLMYNLSIESVKFTKIKK